MLACSSTSSYSAVAKERSWTLFVVKVESLHNTPVAAGNGVPATPSVHESIVGDDTINWEITRPH